MLLLKFAMGGFAVMAATWISQRLGSRVGGLLAGFPAVFTAALIAVAFSNAGAHTDAALFQMVLGTGASLLAALIVAWLAPKVFRRTAFLRGWLLLLGTWALVAASTGLFLHVA